MIASLLETSNVNELSIRQAVENAIDNKHAIGIWVSRPTKAEVRSAFGGDSVPGVLIMARTVATPVPLTSGQGISAAAKSSTVTVTVTNCNTNLCAIQHEVSAQVLPINSVIDAVEAKVTTRLRVRSVHFRKQMQIPRGQVPGGTYPQNLTPGPAISVRPVGTVVPIGAGTFPFEAMTYHSTSDHPSATVQYIPFHELS